MESIFLFLVIVEVLFYAAGRITNVRYGELIGMRIFLVMCLIMNFLGSAMFLATVLLLFELMPKSWLCGKKAEN